MDLALYIKLKSGKDFMELFSAHGAISLVADASGVPTVERWDETIVGFPKMTPAEIAAVLAKPDQVNPDDIKAECKRRIVAVASETQQSNILAHMQLGATDAEKTAFAACMTWIKSMRDACAKLIAANAIDYTADDAWPAVPAGVAAFVSSI